MIGKVVGVERFSDSVMKVNIVVGDIVLGLISCYCPQADRFSKSKKTGFMN